MIAADPTEFWEEVQLPNSQKLDHVMTVSISEVKRFTLKMTTILQEGN